MEAIQMNHCHNERERCEDQHSRDGDAGVNPQAFAGCGNFEQATGPIGSAKGGCCEGWLNRPGEEVIGLLRQNEQLHTSNKYQYSSKVEHTSHPGVQWP